MMFLSSYNSLIQEIDQKVIDGFRIWDESFSQTIAAATEEIVMKPIQFWKAHNIFNCK